MPPTAPFMRRLGLGAAVLTIAFSVAACGKDSPEPAAPVDLETPTSTTTTTLATALSPSTSTVPTSTVPTSTVPTSPPSSSLPAVTTTAAPAATTTTTTAVPEPDAGELAAANDALDALDELLAGLGDQVDGLAGDLAADADARNNAG